MIHPHEGPRWPAGADDNPERPETSWLSGSLPEGVGEPATPAAPAQPRPWQAGPNQPQPWQTGPAPYQPTGPTPAGYPSAHQQPPRYGPGAPAPAGYPSGLQQPHDGPGAPAPRKSPTGRVVAAALAVVLVLGVAGVAVWRLWPAGDTRATKTSAAPATCWDPEITGVCPEFTGLDAALYVFPLKDEAAKADCAWNADTWAGVLAPGFVDVYQCRLSDLATSGVITQWPSADAASQGFLDTSLGYTYEDRWTVDGEEMGDLLVRSNTDGGDFYARCYDDLPFCLYMHGEPGMADTGEDGDWTLVVDRFDALNPQEVEALNAFLADNPPSGAPTMVPSRYDVAVPAEIESDVVGHLARGNCLSGLPDLNDALSTPPTVKTVTCAEPHTSQVIGFADITDIRADTTEDDRDPIYTSRCESLMNAWDVPAALRDAAAIYAPSAEERDAGVGVVMCLVHTSTTWTGSALNGTAAGF